MRRVLLSKRRIRHRTWLALSRAAVSLLDFVAFNVRLWGLRLDCEEINAEGVSFIPCAE
jgi:hypothetical protein